MKIKKKICVVTAQPATVKAFLMEHIVQLSSLYDVTVVTNLSSEDFDVLPSCVTVKSIAIHRDINLWSDFKALIALWIFFKAQHFDLTLSVTPKAGLLTSISAVLSGVPIRLHWFTGQVWVTKTGLKRLILKSFDKLLAFCITDALVDSGSQFDFLIKENVLKKNKGEVLGEGSICGVNIERFKFNQQSHDEYRAKLKLTSENKVLLFLGRLNKDKGVFDLVEAFNQIENLNNNVHLVLVGPDEQNVKQALEAANQTNTNIHFVGGTSAPEKWLSIADVFCLPSYREGFGSSVIEAAAAGVPSVASRIYGLTDAVVENETGLMHQAANIEQLVDTLNSIIRDDISRKRMGKNAFKRAKESFNNLHVTHLLLQYLYQKLTKR